MCDTMFYIPPLENRCNLLVYNFLPVAGHYWKLYHLLYRDSSLLKIDLQDKMWKLPITFNFATLKCCFSFEFFPHFPFILFPSFFKSFLLPLSFPFSVFLSVLLVYLFFLQSIKLFTPLFWLFPLQNSNVET